MASLSKSCAVCLGSNCLVSCGSTSLWNPRANNSLTQLAQITPISTVTLMRIQGLARPAAISNRVAPHLIALRRKSAARSSPVTIVSYPLNHQDRTVVPAKMGMKTRFIRLQPRAKTAGECSYNKGCRERLLRRGKPHGKNFVVFAESEVVCGELFQPGWP